MKKQSRMTSVLLSCVLIGGLFIGFTGQTAAAASALPDTIRVVAGGVGGTQYMLGTALAPTLQKHLKVKVRVMPMETIRERFVCFREGRAELGCVSYLNMELSTVGIEQFSSGGDGPQDMRVVWYLFDTPMAYIVRADSDIKSLKDIKGKRVAIGVFSPTVTNWVNAALEIAGLTKDDVTFVPFGNIGALYRSVGQGKSDISGAVLTSSAVYETESMPHGLRVIGIPHKDKRAWEIWQRYFPLYTPGVLGEKGISSSKGVEGSVGVYGLAAHEKVSADLIYQVMKVLWKNYGEYKEAHRYLKYGSPDAQRQWLDVNPLPYHPGAIKLLKEKGVWTDADTQNNEKALALSRKWKETWEAAVKAGESRKMKLSITNKEWMDLWKERYEKLARFRVRTK